MPSMVKSPRPLGYIRPMRPVFDRPSLGESVSGGLGQIAQHVFNVLEAEKKKKLEEEERKKKEEERDLQLQIALRNIGVEEALTPVPGERPTVPEGETITTQARDVSGLMGEPGTAVGAPRPITMTGPAPSRRTTEIPAISFRGREVAPARSIPATYAGEIEKAKRETGTEVITPEMWEELPEFYKSRWQPGQRVPSQALGTVGTQIFEAAQKRADAKAKAPTSRTRAGRTEEWDPETRTWKDVGPSAAPEKAVWVTDTSTGKRVRVKPGALESAEPGRYSDIEPKEAGLKWVTETSTGNRVQVSPAELAAAPKGKYSDVRPTKTTITSGQMAQSREAALQVLGSPSDAKGDSLWALSKKLSVPKHIPTAIGGPLGKAAGLAASAARSAGVAPDVELYESQITGFIPLFARAVGHSGVLTEKDVERTEKLFPVPGDTEEVATRKMNRLQNIMQGKEKVPSGLWEPQPGVWPPGPPQGITDDEQSLLKEYGYNQ